MKSPLLLDLSHTSHTRARTGIQRVTRSLQTTLADNAVPITYDPYRSLWRRLNWGESRQLKAEGISARRGARWPLSVRVYSWLRQRVIKTEMRPRVAADLAASGTGGLLVPELFSPGVAAALPVLFAATRGPRVALFHDAIALKFPELSPQKTVARFPAYLQELLAFDGIAAVSEDSAITLQEYWQWLGLRDTPPLQTIPLGLHIEESQRPTEASPPSDPPTVLSVGSLEGRKNHLALLEACERLWTDGLSFQLHLIGLAQTETGRAALERIRVLQKAGRPLRYDGPVRETRLVQAYDQCSFSVYPSLMEGFGLPVLESLAYGKPCICSNRGALGEATMGGGCIALASTDATSLATAIQAVLEAPEKLAQLSLEARARRLRPWSDYVADLSNWMQQLPRRP